MTTSTFPPPPVVRLNGQQVTRVAARAGVDPKTVRRYIAGRPVHSTTRDRLERAIAKVLSGAR